MKTISREEFEKIYGTEALNNLGSVQQRPQSPLKDVGLGIAKGFGDTATETANMFVEGGRMIQAGLNPNETYGEMSQRLDTEADASPAWANPFSGQTEENRREMLKSDNKTQTFGKGIAFGAEMMFPVTATAKALSKGDEAVDIVRNTMRKADIDTPKFPRQKAADFVNKYRTQLSDINPQYETVLKQQENPDKMLSYFNAAEQSAVDASSPMATTIASKRGVEAYDALATGMQEAGSMKGSLLDSIADVKIGGNIPGRSIDNVKSVVESRYGMTIDNKGNFTQMDGRIAKLDEPSQKLLQDYITELRSLGQSPTARQLDDWVDKMQAMLYKQSSPNLYAVADDPVISFLKGQTGEINGQLKNNVDEVLKAQGKDPAYGALNDQYARLINAQKDLNKALGTEGDKGASLMKSLFSPQTGERTRRLFQTVQDETGINLFEEATLAKFAMESVGDPRSKSLLQQLDILADDSAQLDLTKPGSWLNFAREKVDLDGKKLGEQIIKQNLDEARKLTPAQETGLQELSKRLNESSPSSVPDYLKNNKQAGFFKLPFKGKINSQTTPAGVAKLMDDSTFDGVTAILEDIPTAKQNPAVNRFLDDMNLSKASDDELEAFLKEVTTEYEVLNPPKPLGKAKGATPNLVEEAKKYDNVDKFYDDYVADSLFDLSDPHKHRYGRLFEDGVWEDTGEYLDLNKMQDIYQDQFKYHPQAEVPIVSSPDDMVTIYRGTTKAQNEIQPGDFVSFSKQYALNHNEGENLLQLQVPAKDVTWQQNAFEEWIYSPESIRGKTYNGGLRTLWAEANGVDPIQVDPYFKFAKDYKSGDEFADAFVSGRPREEMINIWNEAHK